MSFKTTGRGHRKKEGSEILRGFNGGQVILNIKFKTPKTNRG